MALLDQTKSIRYAKFCVSRPMRRENVGVNSRQNEHF